MSDTTITCVTVDDDGWEVELSLPARYEVCDGCRGKGTHVHRGIDGNGLTPWDFAEDPDFAEDYFSGRYDVTCEDCNGLRVVPVVDEKAADPRDLELYYEHERALAELRAEEAAERRMGA